MDLTAEQRAALVEFIFIAVTPFEWVEEDGFVRGAYVPGTQQSYNCTRFPVHDRLREKCAEWLAEGKIKVFPLTFGKQFVMTTPTEPLT